MGDDKLTCPATELITQVKKNVTIDWTLRESAGIAIKAIVKRMLIRHRPDTRSQFRDVADGLSPDTNFRINIRCNQRISFCCNPTATSSKCDPGP